MVGMVTDLKKLMSPTILLLLSADSFPLKPVVRTGYIDIQDLQALQDEPS